MFWTSTRCYRSSLIPTRARSMIISATLRMCNIKAVRERNGVIEINFLSGFTHPEPEQATIDHRKYGWLHYELQHASFFGLC